MFPFDSVVVDRYMEPVYEFIKEFADAGFSPDFCEQQGFQYAIAIQDASSAQSHAYTMSNAKNIVLVAMKKLRDEMREKRKQLQEEVYDRIIANNPGVITGPTR